MPHGMDTSYYWRQQRIASVEPRVDAGNMSTNAPERGRAGILQGRGDPARAGILQGRGPCVWAIVCEATPLLSPGQTDTSVRATGGYCWPDAILGWLNRWLQL